MRFPSPLLRTILLLWLCCLARGAFGARSVALVGMRIAVSFNAPVLSALGCSVGSPNADRTPLWTLSPLSVSMNDALTSEVRGTFRLVAPAPDSDLRIVGDLSELADPLVLRCATGPSDRRIELLSPGPGAIRLLDSDGRLIFVADHPHASLDEERGLYQLFNLDLRIGFDLARELGQTSLTGIAVGTLALAAQTDGQLPAIAAGSACVSAGWEGIIDVELTDISAVDPADQADGSVSLTPTAHLRNVGTADVPWFRKFVPIQSPPDPLPASFGELDQHPYLVWSLYRVDPEGRLRQLGLSPMKHAFNATNTHCGCSSTTHDRFFPGCRDLYSSSTNRADRFLGPRDELQARLGLWTSCGSHFDQDGDCEADVDHHDGAVAQHRLVVDDVHLDLPGHRYFLSAWYLVRGDVDLFNSMGFVEIDPTPGALWMFPVVGPGFSNGSILDLWVDSLSASFEPAVIRTLDTGEGHLQLALKRTQVGDRYRFDVVVANHDYDR